MTKLRDELRVARRWEKETTAFVHAADHADAMSISAGKTGRGNAMRDMMLPCKLYLNSNLKIIF